MVFMIVDIIKYYVAALFKEEKSGIVSFP